MQRRLHLAGWLVFLLCAVLFIVSGLRSGDPWALLGGISFLAGVICFLIPFVVDRDP